MSLSHRLPRAVLSNTGPRAGDAPQQHVGPSRCTGGLTASSEVVYSLSSMAHLV